MIKLGSTNIRVPAGSFSRNLRPFKDFLSQNFQTLTPILLKMLLT